MPVVTSTIPANGAINVPLNQKIAATFNQAMNPGMITAAGTFTVAVSGGGAAVPGTVTYVAASSTAIFTPTANLAPSTHYTATVTTAAQSIGGILLAANYMWSFTTGILVNNTPPTVISTVPVSGAIGVATNTTVTATFSRAMDPTTITATGTFTLVSRGRVSCRARNRSICRYDRHLCADQRAGSLNSSLPPSPRRRRT